MYSSSSPAVLKFAKRLLLDETCGHQFNKPSAFEKIEGALLSLVFVLYSILSFGGAIYYGIRIGTMSSNYLLTFYGSIMMIEFFKRIQILGLEIFPTHKN